MSEQIDAKEIVMSCLRAINREDFKTARQFVADDLSFVGVDGLASGRQYLLQRYGADGS